MRSRDHVLGGLSLLRTRAGPLIETELVVAQCIATIAALTIIQDRAQRSHERSRQQLEPLASRVMIEQAKGFLAHHHGETPKEAFTRLRNYSRRRRLRITTVAGEVIAGRLDLG
jgi:AmiR/NasT family two-component response regulator